jgi:hypothetical protein
VGFTTAFVVVPHVTLMAVRDCAFVLRLRRSVDSTPGRILPTGQQRKLLRDPFIAAPNP